jgi:hypothetical protein
MEEKTMTEQECAGIFLDILERRRACDGGKAWALVTQVHIASGGRRREDVQIGIIRAFDAMVAEETAESERLRRMIGDGVRGL